MFVTYRNMYKLLANGDKNTIKAIIKLLNHTREATLNKWLEGSSDNDEATKAYLKYLRALQWNIENAKEQYKDLQTEEETLDWMRPEWLNDTKDPHQALDELVYDKETPIEPPKGG